MAVPRTSFVPSGVKAKAEAPVDSTDSGRCKRRMEVKSRTRFGLISPSSYKDVSFLKFTESNKENTPI